MASEEPGAVQLATNALIRAEARRQENDLSDVQQINVDAIPDAIAKIRKRAEIDSESFLPPEVMRAP